MAGIPITKDTVPTFDDLYGDRLGPLNDFETATFYSDFTRMMSNTLLTSSLQDQCVRFSRFVLLKI